MSKPDRIDRILAASRKRDAIDGALHVLAEAKRQIREARRVIGGDPSYAKNRMGCVVAEIDAATTGLKVERGNLSRSIAGFGRAAARKG